MSRSPLLIALLAVALPLAGCDSNGDDDPSIADLAQNTPSLSTLDTALGQADLVSTLDSGGPFTVFAPNNGAFDTVQGDLLNAILADDDQLDDLLTYHVVRGTFRAEDLEDGDTLTALNGDELTVTVTNAGTFIDGVRVVSADIEATNGVVHIVEEVLINPIDIVDAAGLLGFTELAGFLTPALVTSLQGDGPFTVFAPTNTAFQDIESTTDNLTPAQLTNVLLYHVAPVATPSGSLSPDQVVPTLLTDQTVTVRINGTTITIDGDDADGEVAIPDVIVGNGVIHAIDGVLLPDSF
ncbi:MAG: fasciclin domain-containing protein [Bacteroidota bacterium]